MPGTLYTQGAVIQMTAAELESFDAIRHSAGQPGLPVTLAVTDGGLVDLSAELGSTPAILQAAVATATTLVAGSGADWLFGALAADTLAGGRGNDTLLGHNGDDVLDGGDGDDALQGMTGHDTLFGGAGNDVLAQDVVGSLDPEGAAGAIFGGSGNDEVWLSGGSADGGAGRDTLVVPGGDLAAVAFAGFEVLATDREPVRGTVAALESFQVIQATPTDATDGVTIEITDGGRLDLAAELGLRGATIATSAAGNLLILGAGDDLAAGQDAGDTMMGGAGGDWLYGGGGQDALTGGADGDFLFGNDGNDRLSGGDGDDELGGGARADLLDGGLGADVMGGGAGDDRYVVDDAGDVVSEEATGLGLDDGGHDRVTASVDFTLGAFAEDLTLAGAAVQGTGNGLANVVAGTAGANDLAGLGGDDRLSGGDGRDSLSGGAGVDLLYGGNGDDRLAGGTGRDTLFGGAGADVILLDGLDAPDRLHDMISGEDRIVLAEAAFGELGDGSLDPGSFHLGRVAADAGDRLVYDRASGRLWFDADGSGAGAAVQVAALDPGAALAAGDLDIL